MTMGEGRAPLMVISKIDSVHSQLESLTKSFIEKRSWKRYGGATVEVNLN
jgi:hypothetical protein